ncbi:MAG: hypothetical protein COA79_01755 [Planctomycetota bacterium]|nr:MAG: hypothetical protein COA79_01755 [Planctomycetota bacterium]
MSVKILIADDDNDIRELIKNILILEDYIILEAANGDEALKILDQQEVNLLITDIFMPKMSGIELAVKIKAHYANLKILGITGGGNFVSSDQVKMMSNDFFTSFLKKPFEYTELIEKVKELL